MAKTADSDPKIAIAAALEYVGMSPNESDRNGEPANLVDGLFAIARAIEGLTIAIQENKGNEK